MALHFQFSTSYYSVLLCNQHTPPKISTQLSKHHQLSKLTEVSDAISLQEHVENKVKFPGGFPGFLSEGPFPPSQLLSQALFCVLFVKEVCNKHFILHKSIKPQNSDRPLRRIGTPRIIKKNAHQDQMLPFSVLFWFDNLAFFVHRPLRSSYSKWTLVGHFWLRPEAKKTFFSKNAFKLLYKHKSGFLF